MSPVLRQSDRSSTCETLPSAPNTWKYMGSALRIYINVNKYEYTFLKQIIWLKKKKGNFQESEVERKYRQIGA